MTGERVDSDAHPNSNELDVSPEKGVRERAETASAAPVLVDVPPPPAHPSNRLLAQLNADWRVEDDPLQWILQRKKGNPRQKHSGWQNRSFCRTREGLLRCVCEYCGEVDDKALTQLHALPEFHSDWDLSQ
jgi:hypothetical protein